MHADGELFTGEVPVSRSAGRVVSLAHLTSEIQMGTRPVIRNQGFVLEAIPRRPPTEASTLA